MTAATTAEEAVHEASAHLYEALTHHFGPLDLGAHEPLVLAIAEYGQQCRKGDNVSIDTASKHIFEALTHHFRPLDLGAHEPITVALAEFGKACRAAGTKG